jgi:hypothetical protein
LVAQNKLWQDHYRKINLYRTFLMPLLLFLSIKSFPMSPLAALSKAFQC